jgi:di/tricarboxylate transporter
MSALLWVIIVAFVLCIVIGHFTNTNIGVLAIIASYIIGVFFMGLRTSAVVLMWPTKITFTLIGVTFYYGFLQQNGTLRWIIDLFIYRARNHPRVIPVAIFLIGFLFAFIGVAPPACLGFLAPIVISLTIKADMNRLLGVIALGAGVNMGGVGPLGQVWLIAKGLFEDGGYAGDLSVLSWRVFANGASIAIGMFVIGYFVLKGYRMKPIVTEELAPMAPIQKKSLVLTGIIVACIFLPSIVQSFFPNKVTLFLSAKSDITMFQFIGVFIACLMKLGDAKRIVKENIPWNLIIMIGGTCMLVGIMVQAGFTDAISELVTRMANPVVYCAILMMTAQFVSLVSDAVSVAMPLVAPIALGLVGASRISASALLCCVPIGAFFNFASPFSSGGSLMLAGSNEEGRQKQFLEQLMLTICILVYLFVISRLNLLI